MGIDDIKRAPPGLLPRLGSHKTQRAAHGLAQQQADTERYWQERFAGAYGWFSTYDDAAPVLVTSLADTWIDWEPDMDAEHEGVSLTGGVIRPLVSGLFRVEMTFVVFLRTGAGRHVFCSPFVNGIERPRGGTHIMNKTGGESSITGRGYFRMTPEDTLELRLKQDGAGELELHQASVIFNKEYP